MRKETSKIIALAIATVLTAYISALTLSNQAFAQTFPPPPPINTIIPPPPIIHTLPPGLGSAENSGRIVLQQVKKVLSGELGQLGGSLSDLPLCVGDMLEANGPGTMGHVGVNLGQTFFGLRLSGLGLLGGSDLQKAIGGNVGGALGQSQPGNNHGLLGIASGDMSLAETTLEMSLTRMYVEHVLFRFRFMNQKRLRAVAGL